MSQAWHGPLGAFSGLKMLSICCAVTVLAAGPLAGCATAPEPRIEIRTVEVPVAVRCAVTVPAEPAYGDDKASIDAADGIFAKLKLLLAGRELREAYKNEVKAALIGCTG